MKRKWLWLVLMLALAGTAVAGWEKWNRSQPVAPAVEGYQAVLLTNGQVYYGRLQGLGTKFPVLTEVYYVQAGVDTSTKQARSVLLKRGKEWHAPSRMVLNADHILLVEPVGANSQVAALIAAGK